MLHILLIGTNTGKMSEDQLNINPLGLPGNGAVRHALWGGWCDAARDDGRRRP